MPPTTNNSYHPAIDGLRAIAVIAVIINHFDHRALPSGYLGVDIFFVISGYVITASLAARQDQSARELLFGFYQRRIKRLYPALAACVLLTGVALCLFNPEPLPQLKTAAFSLFGASNIQLHLNAVDYWGEPAELNPFTHTWSLGVEEQFYLIFPILVVFTVLGNWSTANRFKLKCLLILISTASLGWFLAEATDSASSTYYLMHFRFWELGIGCILFLFISEQRAWKSKLASGPTSSVILIAALVFALFIPGQYPVSATLLVVFLTAVSIACIQLQTSKFTLLDNRLMVGLGLVSYSLYLWHWPVIVISRYTVGVSWWTAPIQLAAIFALSLASYFYIETPFRKSYWLKTRKQRFLTTSAASLCATLIIAMMALAPSQFLYLGKKVGEQRATNATHKVNCGVKATDNSVSIQTVRTVGNSHSNHIVPMLREIGQKCGWTILHEKYPDYIVIPGGNNNEMNRLSEVLLPLQSGDLLILSARNRKLYEIPYLNGRGEKWIEGHLKKEIGSRVSSWIGELEVIINEAGSRNVDVILFLPNVEFDTQVMKPSMCRQEWFQLPPKGCNPRVSKEFLSSRFPSEFFEEVAHRAAQYENFHVFDPLPIYCKGKYFCSRKIDGVFAFADTNHLTPQGSLLMLESFNEFLLENDLIWDITAPDH